MRRVQILPCLVAALWVVSAQADDPPVISHQPLPCTIPERRFKLCATVTDDSAVAKSRILFRAADDKFYSAVDMTFGGLSYCGTLPAPREGKVKVIEYYIQAFDDHYQLERTSTFRLTVSPEGACEFPPVVDQQEATSPLVVYATAKQQGKKLPGGFRQEGVSYVPVAK